MAIYEYLCPRCRAVFEVTRPMSESNEPAKCPKCNTSGEKLPSVFSSTAGTSVKGPDKAAFRANLERTHVKLRRTRAKSRAKASPEKKRERKA